ncbi:hotdog family protein [Mycolicibacterium litorale]|uniref:Thioesterase n=1 Tax=Mycolicibacterium litorale TaxID=758802 RepID=A0AAD1MV02_9MYCO|nr:hypothetical protein [Mycolicibacterium litorale]MCV7415732.1 hypothetical protein [Mycolicibacterium litorale]TDY08986.1 hypothetical protein BCL50_1063 [Mycolicibacterium litorale]BBY16917.1 hypothetical protein MLIT_25090 [Mycolicibacterium litorale]
MDQPVVRFGEQPLAQTVAAAAALRRVTGVLLALEHPHPAVDEMTARLATWERELSAVAPADAAPRVGDDLGDERRVYLDHAYDCGAFNPCFPAYRLDHIDGTAAAGRVSFPLPYEGPPGLVHGGFLAVFFDCVIQHHNCATGLSGKTRSLNLTYRRPTPLLTELRFEIERTTAERGITSIAHLRLEDELLCTGEATTVALPPERLVGARFGARRPQSRPATGKEPAP